MGPSGERLANLLLKSREITERIASLHWSVVDRAWSKLSKKEAADLVDVIEGRATIALNQKQEMARGLFEAEREKLAEDFKSRGFTMIRNKMELDPASGQMVSKGTEEVPFATRANYFPHQVDTEKLDSRGITRIIKHLVDTGQAKNEGDALELYQNYMKEFRQRRAGSMEHSRSPIELPEDMYVKDPRTRIHDYLFDSYRRLIESEPMMLGKNDANAYALLEGIRKDMTSRGGSDSYASQQVLLAEKMLNRVLGKDMEFEPELLRMARLWQMPSLGLSAIPNAFQSVNTAVAMGIRNTIRGIGDFMGQEGKDFAMRAGAISESVSRELSPDLAGGLGERFAKGIFKYTGFNLTEKWNRGIASNTAKYYLMDLMKIMQRNPLDKQALLKMYEIGVSPSALREMQASGWTEVGANIFEAVGQKMSNYTQHRSGVLDLPLFFTSPYGRFLTQFKNFPFKQAQFISKEVFKEAANGNFTPLIRFAVLGTSMGEASADLKALARGDTKRWNKPAVQREIENMTAVGAMGVFSDTIQSFVSGGTSPYKMLVGPTLGDVVTAGTAVAQGAQGRVRPIEKFGTSQIPIVGPWITNKLFPPLR